MIVVIYDRDNTHIDSEKDQRGCYKRGDIVAIHPDSAHDGDTVTNPISPPWYLVRVTGSIPDNIMDLIQPEVSSVLFEPDGVTPKRMRRRAWRLNLDQVPQAIMDQLNATRYYEIDVSQIRGNIRNKNTNEAF